MFPLAFLAAALLSGPWLLACESAPAPAPRSAEPPPEPSPPPLDVFDADRAFRDLEALVAIGPRVAGSTGSAAARAHLRAELEAIGIAVEEVATPRGIPGREPETLHHLVATLPGASPGLFVIVAPYDSSRLQGTDLIGANDGASGAALLLELGRVLSTRTLPYTTRLVFLDGEGRIEAEASSEAGVGDGAPGSPGVARWSGGAALAEHMQQAGELDDVRLLVALHQVADADLRIARDLSSHRVHREEFFKAAERMARTDAFPRAQTFESPEASHLAFRKRGVRAVVALVDTSYGGDTPPGVYAESAEDGLEHCAPESLEAVGVVTLEALETIGRRLERIDRFARSPLTEVETSQRDAEPAPPAPEAGAEPAQAVDAASPPEPDPAGE